MPLDPNRARYFYSRAIGSTGMKRIYTVAPLARHGRQIAAEYGLCATCTRSSKFLFLNIGYRKMALTPLIRHLLDDVDRQMSLFDQHFGLGLTHDDLLFPRLSVVPALSGYYRPWRHLAARNSGVSTIQNNKDGFEVNLDVQQFKPEELTVKVVGDSVLVEGKHEERQDEHGYISRHMQRRYLLPKDVEVDQVQTQLSSDGVLTITAPKKALPPAEGGERVVQVVQTGVPAVSNQQQQGEEKMEK